MTENLDACRGEKLLAWMKEMKFSVEEVRRALEVVEQGQAQGIVDLAKLMDLVRRDQLGRVMDYVIRKGIVFPEGSRLEEFHTWVERGDGTRIPVMLEAVHARNWPLTYDTGVDLGMDNSVIEDVYNPVTVENVSWVLKKVGRREYMNSEGEKQEIDEGEKPDLLLHKSIEKFIPLSLVAADSKLRFMDVVKLAGLARRDQMKRITDYICESLKEDIKIPSDVGYPEGHRLYEFGKAVAQRVRILARLTTRDPRYAGLQMGLFRLVNAVVTWDEKVVEEMCEFFGIQADLRWIVCMTEITWILWETGNAKFIDSDGKKRDAHEELKTRPSDDVKASIEKFIPECLV